MTEEHEPKPFPPRYTVCAVGGDDDESIQKAKDWIKEKGLTSEDVKIVRDDGSILVVTKREVVIL